MLSLWKALSTISAVMAMFDSNKYIVMGDELKALGLYLFSTTILFLVFYLDWVEKDEGAGEAEDQAAGLDNDCA